MSRPNTSFPIHLSNSRNDTYVYAKPEYIDVLRELYSELWGFSPKKSKYRLPAKAVTENCLGYISNPATNEILNKLKLIDDDDLEINCYYPTTRYTWRHKDYQTYCEKYLLNSDQGQSIAKKLGNLIKIIFLTSGNELPLTTILHRQLYDAELSGEPLHLCLVSKDVPKELWR